MKIKPILLLLCFFTFIIQARIVNKTFIDPIESVIAVIIMVKNEADVIIPTLQPLVDVGVNAILVYDTGSTDGTQKVVSSYFKKNNLSHAYVIEDPFIDFSTSRNRALDNAESLFPHVTFFLMLDAEWYTHNAQELVDFCHRYKNYTDPGTDGECYAIRLLTKDDAIDNYTTRLMRAGKNVRYAGVVHESVQKACSGCLPKSIYFEYAPQENGKKKSTDRFIRDYNLLKKSLESDSNPRTLFYLGQTCQFLDRWEEAITYYQKRADIGDISEECFLALYRIGCALEYLYVHKNENSQYRWEDALHYYLKAHAMLAHRAEPLVRIANYYIYMKEYSVAYLFALRAVNLPYPSDDVLFVEKVTYEYTRYDLLGRCAIYLGEYEIGKNAILKAIKAAPQNQHLYNNLAWYMQHITV